MEADHAELPDAARDEDLSTVRGRLRAALIRAGRAPEYGSLLLLLRDAKVEINRQTVHNWFRTQARQIDSRYLFAVSDVLKVSARWLATGEAPLGVVPTTLSPGARAVLEAWEALPTADYKLAMIQSMRELTKQHRAEVWVPGVTPDRRNVVR